MAVQQNKPPSGAPGAGGAPPVGGARKGRRGRWPQWRVFTWVILGINLIMLIWLVVGVASTAKDCTGLTGQALTDCEAGNVGTGLGATMIVVLWVCIDVILGVLWLVTRPHRRYCPACGEKVARGLMRCGNCGFDFGQGLAARPDGGRPTAEG